MMFVVVSRTALVTMPIMLAVFALLHLKMANPSSRYVHGAVLAAAGLERVVPAAAANRHDSSSRDYQIYKRSRTADVASGSRLRILAEIAAVHRRGAGDRARHRIDARAVRAGGDRPEVGAGGQVVGNPHNQTLHVAIQWGVLGVVVLYAMWWLHLTLFRGEGLAAWIGLMVVVQNIFTSLFNSHLFDFHEGWMYVLGVGVAGGMVLGARRDSAPAASHQS